MHAEHIDTIERAITEVTDAPMVTRWLIIAEAVADDGQPYLHYVTSPGLPPWQTVGMLTYATRTCDPQPAWTADEDDTE